MSLFRPQAGFFFFNQFVCGLIKLLKPRRHNAQEPSSASWQYWTVVPAQCYTQRVTALFPDINYLCH